MPPLSISWVLPSSPSLEMEPPPSPVCLIRYLLLGRKGLRVLPDSSLYFFPKKASQLYSILALSGECQANMLEACLFTSISLMLLVLLHPPPKVCPLSRVTVCQLVWGHLSGSKLPLEWCIWLLILCLGCLTGTV